MRKRQSILLNTRKTYEFFGFQFMAKIKNYFVFSGVDLRYNQRYIFYYSSLVLYWFKDISIYLRYKKQKPTWLVHTYQSLKHSLKHSYFRMNSRYLGYDRQHYNHPVLIICPDNCFRFIIAGYFCCCKSGQETCMRRACVHMTAVPIKDGIYANFDRVVSLCISLYYISPQFFIRVQ